MRTVNGVPGMLISLKATLLIETLAGKYRDRINAKGVQDDTPEKSQLFSDVVDAVQYACLHHDCEALFNGGEASARREVKRVSFAWG